MMMSLPAISRDRVFVSRKGRTREVGRFTCRVRKHGHVLAQLQKSVAIGWHWEGHFCPLWHKWTHHLAQVY